MSVRTGRLTVASNCSPKNLRTQRAQRTTAEEAEGGLATLQFSWLEKGKLQIWKRKVSGSWATDDQRLILDSQFLDFLVVVLAVEDVPLLAAFEDGALLAFDFLAGGLVDAGFLHEEFFENFTHFESNRVPVFDEVGFGRLGQRVGNDVG